MTMVKSNLYIGNDGYAYTNAYTFIFGDDTDVVSKINGLNGCDKEAALTALDFFKSTGNKVVAVEYSNDGVALNCEVCDYDVVNL